MVAALIGAKGGTQPRIADAIQDRAVRTAGEAYGDVALKAKYEAIKMLPRYPHRAAPEETLRAQGESLASMNRLPATHYRCSTNPAYGHP